MYRQQGGFVKKALYVGLELPKHLQGGHVDHCPLIEVKARDSSDPAIGKVFGKLHEYTHLIFTSKSSVEILYSYARKYGYQINASTVFAVGRSTAAAVSSYSNVCTIVAEEETAEGVVAMLKRQDLESACVLWPHSALSRPLIADHLAARGIACDACVFYTTHTRRPENVVNLERYDEIIFTSPSTVNAFIEIFGSLPDDKLLTSIGPITKIRLEQVRITNLIS
jgi:uroporphyrinogen-III synthase